MTRLPDRIHVELPEFTFDDARLEAAFLAELRSPTGPPPEMSNENSPRRAIAWCAALAAVAAAVLVLWGTSGSSHPYVLASEGYIPNGNLRVVDLGGATLRYGANTELVLQITSKQIKVRLRRGSVEGYVRDNTHALTIYASNTKIQPKEPESEFAVTATDVTRVRVVRGSVFLSSAQVQRVLREGESFVFRSSFRTTSPRHARTRIDTKPPLPGMPSPSDTSRLLHRSLPPRTLPHQKRTRNAGIVRQRAPARSAMRTLTTRESQKESNSAKPPRTPERVSFAELLASLPAPAPGADAWTLRKRANGSGRDAATALYALARLELVSRRPNRALEVTMEYGRRFKQSGPVQTVAWLRAVAFHAGGRRAEARRAALAYLRSYPSGSFARLARALTRRSPTDVN